MALQKYLPSKYFWPRQKGFSARSHQTTISLISDFDFDHASKIGPIVGEETSFDEDISAMYQCVPMCEKCTAL
ncbi:uncharacterized protein PGTG_05862 [Puccinia graminis f. sp. tritici CRL 75-36-700-3]|uniref:Uncharacterized protein n=1 Tax=Puccinia graminis f. sp. tritici (strain CRL 75-36-700-3 / race SCCL) TaxID=418459 RepID=E3K5X0_PUCGT|nr:uncharacterized protein PGTG_05862 [Puccinia graminis f. sp. tritici CRL 75-36-700-3]EFP79541.2 hypothetical protein PGTG_05862 [Puccinia graminis f. sp. tritici CRL 75-36-700-3]